jgi:hypothetical protein
MDRFTSIFRTVYKTLAVYRAVLEQCKKGRTIFLTHFIRWQVTKGDLKREVK